MERHADDLNFVQAASALALDQADFSNLLKQKSFVGRRSGYRNEHLISRSEIAALFGRALSDAEFNRARTVKTNDIKRQGVTISRKPFAKRPIDQDELQQVNAAFDQAMGPGYAAAHPEFGIAWCRRKVRDPHTTIMSMVAGMKKKRDAALNSFRRDMT